MFYFSFAIETKNGLLCVFIVGGVKFRIIKNKSYQLYSKCSLNTELNFGLLNDLVCLLNQTRLAFRGRNGGTQSALHLLMTPVKSQESG